jgi:predicted transcriptional regulator of viral defense system
MSILAYNADKISVNLSPLEHKVYFSFYEKEVIRNEDIYKTILNKKTARQILFRLNTKGYLKQIHRGLYAIVPAQMIGKAFTADKIMLSSRLTEPYFISHHTALEIHGVSQSFLNVSYVSTNKILKPFDFQDILYKFVNTKYMFGVEQVLRGSYKISVSDRERTILDCIRNIDYAGGFEELAKSISAFPAINYNNMLKYMALFNENSLYHRTGFIFYLLKGELNVPADFLEAIKERLSARAYYLIPGRRGTYFKEWNIIAPKNVMELMKVFSSF